MRLAQGLGTTDSVFEFTEGAPSTRLGARADFTKLSILWGGARRFDSLTVTLALRAQASMGKPVFNSEQLTLDGADALSGLSPGRYAVDEGGTLRAELGTDRLWASGGSIAPYFYASAGTGKVHGTTVVESSTLHAVGLGVGARLRSWRPASGGQSVAFAVEAGHSSVHAAQVYRNYRINLALTLGF